MMLSFYCDGMPTVEIETSIESTQFFLVSDLTDETSVK